MRSGGTTSVVERAIEIVRDCDRAVALTGGGLSMASGLPDAGDSQSTTSRGGDLGYADFQRSEEARREHWSREAGAIGEILGARPNPGHDALARMEAAGRLVGTITQNIDGLHQTAGARTVLELGGSRRRAVCTGCGADEAIEPVLERWERDQEVPHCRECSGALKPATLAGGELLAPDIVRQAIQLTRHADCLLALGTSLQTPLAASLVEVAREHGSRVVVVTRSSTPYDKLVDVKLDEPVASCLPTIVDGALAS